MITGIFPHLFFFIFSFATMQTSSEPQCQEAELKECPDNTLFSYKSILIADKEKMRKLGRRFQIQNSGERREYKPDLGKRDSAKKNYMEDQAEGAFLEDFYDNMLPFAFVDEKCIEIEITTPKEGTTTEKSKTTTIALTTTTEMPNPIKCQNPIWVLVLPAQIRKMFNGRKVVQDLALRAGFLEFDKSKKFLSKHINETIQDLLQNTSNMIGHIDKAIKDEVNNWISANKDWVEAIVHGSFQYFRIDKDWADKGEIMMLLHNCDFGKFIISPVLRSKNVKIEQTFDWTMDFTHLEECEIEQVDLFASKEREKRIYYLDDSAPMKLKVKLSIGIEVLEEGISMNSQKCEAFKYKYGYTVPLRDPSLNETANDCARIESMGKILLRVDEVVCRSLHTYNLRINVVIFNMVLMKQLGLAKDDCSKGNRNCLKCLLKDPRESDCKPMINVQLIQTIYECSGFNIWLPRLNVHQNFTVDNKTYDFSNRVNRFIVSFGSSFYRQIDVPNGRCQYDLYNEKYWLEHSGSP